MASPQMWISGDVGTARKTYWCVLRREFSGMIPVITSFIIIPATPITRTIHSLRLATVRRGIWAASRRVILWVPSDHQTWLAGKPLNMTVFFKRKLIELNGGFSGDGTESPEGTLR